MRWDRCCSGISPRWSGTSSRCFAPHPCPEELLDLLQAQPCRRHQLKSPFRMPGPTILAGVLAAHACKPDGQTLPFVELTGTISCREFWQEHNRHPQLAFDAGARQSLSALPWNAFRCCLVPQ